METILTLESLIAILSSGQDFLRSCRIAYLGLQEDQEVQPQRIRENIQATARWLKAYRAAAHGEAARFVRFAYFFAISVCLYYVAWSALDRGAVEGSSSVAHRISVAKRINSLIARNMSGRLVPAYHFQ